MDYARLIRAYRKIRDARKELKKKYDSEDRALKEDLARIEVALSREFGRTGVNSIRTDDGTAFRVVVPKVSIADASAFFPWVRENDAFDLLHHRVKSTEVQKYINEHDGAVPPGLNVYTEYAIHVRKS